MNNAIRQPRKPPHFVIGFAAMGQITALYGEKTADLVQEMKYVTRELKTLENDPYLKFGEGANTLKPQSKCHFVAAAALHKKKQLTQKLKTLENDLAGEARARLAALK